MHSTDRQIITLNFGQAGVQISHAMWELFCLEHFICPGGCLQRNIDFCQLPTNSCMFQESKISNRLVPRSLLVDLDPTTIDEIRVGSYRHLFHPDTLINGHEDAASNFSRGYHTLGKSLEQRMENQVRILVENCEKLQGFLIVNGTGGGTGSGLTSLLMKRLSESYPKFDKFQLQIAPCSQHSSIVVEPYNCALNARGDVNLSDLSLFMDNDSLYRQCCNNLDIHSPSFQHINRIIAQILSSLTCNFRFDSPLNADMNQMQVNLVPYPRLHYPLVSYAPLIGRNVADHEAGYSLKNITNELFADSSQLLNVNPTKNKFMCCFIQYRGNASMQSINQAITAIKRNKSIEFVDWCPTGFKIGVCSTPPLCLPMSGMAQVPIAACMFTNNTAIASVWDNIFDKFKRIHKKRAFIHWFVSEGLEEGEFDDAKEEIMLIARDYREVAISEKENNTDSSGNLQSDEGEEVKKNDSADEDYDKFDDKKYVKKSSSSSSPLKKTESDNSIKQKTSASTAAENKIWDEDEDEDEEEEEAEEKRGNDGNYGNDGNDDDSQEEEVITVDDDLQFL